MTDASHGCQQNDFVTYSGAVSLGGNVTADILNAEHQVVRVIDADTYEITVSVTADGSDTGNGGSWHVVGAYQINVGLNTTVGGTGWGAGLYGGTTTGALQTTLNEGGTLTAGDATITLTSTTGIVANDVILIGNELILVGGVSSNDLTGCTRGHSGTTATTHADGSTVRLASGNANPDDDFFGWGNAASGGLTTTTQIRLWSHDNFGEDLAYKPTRLKSTTGTNLVVQVQGPWNYLHWLAPKTSIPTICKQVMVSDRDRHVLAFGCDGINSSSSANQGNGVQDPLLIRFSDQEDPLVWYPAATNTAGDLRLGSGSTFVRALETKREILVWTDTALTSMRFYWPTIYLWFAAACQ